MSKEEIEKAKEMLNKLKDYKVLSSSNFQELLTEEEKDAIETLLHYIDQLEADNYELNNRLNDYIENDKKQNKIIDEMAIEIASSDNYDTFCKEVYPNNSCEDNGIPCWDCVKQYFEKKVEEK